MDPKNAATFAGRDTVDAPGQVSPPEGDSSLSPPGVAGGEPANSAGPRERPGTKIGNYKLLQEIGEGGFGTVFMAEQEAPVVRRVALKVIKLGMDTRLVIARFEAERQALALMDHPNIARVLDAGATDSGRPYFVMELVKGDPITEYCDKANLTIADRLELFMQVCTAVQHAHQKGLIHRDIKPTNVLVSTQDGKAIAKVIDFGIAKATAGRLTDKTLFTEHRQLIGTPEYMSPEQAEGSLDLDTRTDVYSLGVVLYELLTGVTPFDPVRLRSAAFNEMQRMIREDEPPRPSTRLSSLVDEEATRGVDAATAADAATMASEASQPVPKSTASSEAIARHRRTDVRSLSRFIRGDLDWIVMKALEKDRSRRYSSATSLSEDIARFLANEPVLATPPSAGYRLRKLVRRRRGLFAALAGVAVALVIGFGFAAYEFVQANRERDKAVASEHRAIGEAARATASRRFTLNMIERAAAYTGLSKDFTVREMADATCKSLDDGLLADQPEIEFEQRLTLGAVYHSLTRFEEAKTQFTKATALRRRAATGEDLDLARALELLGTTEVDLGNLDEAEAALAEAQRLASRLAPPTDAVNLDIRFAIATLRWNQGRTEEAASGFNQLLADYPAAGRMGTRDEADLQTSLASTLAALPGRLDDALRASKKAVALQRRISGPESANLAGALQSLAWLVRQSGDLHSAAQILKEALSIAERTLPAPHEDTAVIQDNLGAILRDLGMTQEAEGLARKALAAHRALLPKEHPLLAATLGTLGTIELDKGDAQEAEALFREELTIRAAQPGAREIDSTSANVGIAQALLAQHRVPEALELVSRALEVRRAALDPADWRIASTQCTLGRALAASGRNAEAESALIAAAKVMENAAAAGPRLRLMAMDALIAFLSENKRGDEAAPWRLIREKIEQQRVPPAAVVPSPGRS